MKTRIAIVITIAALAACASRKPETAPPAASASRPAMTRVAPESGPASTARSVDDYKRELAKHISRLNESKVFPGRPQALLRSVVVLHYAIDSHGRLSFCEVLRSNHDRETVSTALASLRNSAPFPIPARRLLHHGRLELSETWLFNNDGRFQLRSIAQAQMDR